MAVFVQLLGQVGSGKTYLARRLAAMKKGIVLPFAKDVYRLARIVKGSEIDKSNVEDRELLKLIGTTWGRQAQHVSDDIENRLEVHKPKEWGRPDIWARIFVSNCRALPLDTSVINDDTRFLNELEISMSELGFIPVFVACSERTRQKRLRQRGDSFDPSATDHLSEELANFLRTEVMVAPLMPVVWNDVQDRLDVAVPWVFCRDEFQAIMEKAESSSQLAESLNWTSERAQALLRLLSQTTSDSHV
jgi:hypothetical protein